VALPLCRRACSILHRGPEDPRYRRLQGRGRDRDAGQGGRHRGRRAIAVHRGVRQGLDGNPIALGRHHHGAASSSATPSTWATWSAR
jgi:hypothetical protein